MHLEIIGKMVEEATLQLNPIGDPKSSKLKGQSVTWVGGGTCQVTINDIIYFSLSPDYSISGVP
jgi:hypothetical protein